MLPKVILSYFVFRLHLSYANIFGKHFFLLLLFQSVEKVIIRKLIQLSKNPIQVWIKFFWNFMPGMPSILIQLCLNLSYLQVHLKCCEIFMLITWLITLMLGVESSRIWGLQRAYKKVRKYQLFRRRLQLF